jgi:plasmid maintenance system antidote protein VapI
MDILDGRFGGNQAMMSKETGISRPQLNDYINSKSDITKKMVLRIIARLQVEPPEGMAISDSVLQKATPMQARSMEAGADLMATINALAAQLLRIEAQLTNMQQDLTAMRSWVLPQNRAS